MISSEMADAFADLHYLFGADRPTSLIETPELARHSGVARVFIKAEWQRPLGSFKSLGGMLAGLRALARHAGAGSVAALLEGTRPAGGLPRLICASDGNHGLAVAAAAQRAATGCSIYLPQGVSGARAARIRAMGATVVTIRGTYDHAVDAAEAAAARSEGLLVPDTSQDPRHVVVQDVMSGYSRIAAELVQQFRESGSWPTHAFVPAGVGGLAAALVRDFRRSTGEACRWVVVEPANADCVAQALAARRPVRIAGSLETSAEMLSCGLASAAALEILQAADVTCVAVDEARLATAVDDLRELTGIDTTSSGAAGIAGLHRRAPLDADSVVLVIVTEGSSTG